MTKITQGNWESSGKHVRVKGSLGYIATMSDYDPMEQVANAKLMAAAPCLLKALETLSREEYRDDDDSILEEARDLARAAIAKAKGEQ